jgi:hypothetical protein
MPHGSLRLATLAAALLFPFSAAGQTIHYVLTTESRIVAVQADGGDPPAAEPLAGTFDLTVLPDGGTYAVEALTGVRWESESFRVVGTGFVQRIGDGRLAMVLDARVNGSASLLTSGRRQRSTPGKIRIHLSTPRDRGPAYHVELVAEPVITDGPDPDGDGVPDGVDNCPAVPALDQSDADHDGVGDVCDQCPETSLGNPVSGDGCSPSDQCACEGPNADEEWESPRAYLRCVARALKRLHQQSKLSRREIRRIMQDAVRSACGNRIIALR